MIQISDLLKAIINEFQIIIVKEYPTNRQILRVDILDEHSLLDEHTLYLCGNPNTFDWTKLHRYSVDVQKRQLLLTSSMEELPVTSIHANRLPEIEVLFSYINEYLASESILESQIARLYRCLYQGLGLHAIIDTAQDYFHASVSICDVSYNFLATSSASKTSDYQSDSSSRPYLATEEIASMKHFHVVDRIYQNSGAFFVSTPDHPDSNWIFCAIRIHHVIAGFLAISLSCDDTASPQQLRLATALSDVCSVEMQKHDSYFSKTGLKYENFLIDLLEGRFTDAGMIRSRIEVLDHRFCKYYCIISMVCMRPHDSEIFTRRQMSNLRHLYPNSMSVVYQDTIVLFLNQDEPVFFDEKFTAPLLEFASLNQMKIGISQPFSDVVRISSFYQQSKDAIKFGEISAPENIIYYAIDYSCQHMLEKCPYHDLENYIHYHIRYLDDYDKTYHTEFITTLRSFLACDRNATKTAEYLHIHRSTFFYRVKKIEELLGVSLDNGSLLFSYELSFSIWDYLYH